MRLIHLTLFYCLLNSSSGHKPSEYLASPVSTTAKSMMVNQAPNNLLEPAENVFLQSKDGGQTWEDISHSLPENAQPEDFFAGESEIYLRINNEMYRSKNNLKTPIWKKETLLNPEISSIIFNRSGVMAYNSEGGIFKKELSSGTWLPIAINFNKQSVRNFFETSDGSLLLGSDFGLYKSADKGQSWKQVLNEGGLMDLVESKGVLMATGQKGIMRSTDNGENWEWVLQQGGAGFAIERIEGGFAAISYNTNSRSRRIHSSLDGGKSWKVIDEGLSASLSISSVKQVGYSLLCGHPDGIFRSSDMGKTWNLVHPSVDALGKTWDVSFSVDNRRVFKLYVSGNVVYAVARSGGC